MTAASTTQRFSVYKVLRLCMLVHYPRIAQLEPHEVDLVAASDLHRRGNCAGGTGLSTSGGRRAKPMGGTWLQRPAPMSPLPPSPCDRLTAHRALRQASQRMRNVGMRKPSFLLWNSPEGPVVKCLLNILGLYFLT